MWLHNLGLPSLQNLELANARHGQVPSHGALTAAAWRDAGPGVTSGCQPQLTLSSQRDAQSAAPSVGVTTGAEQRRPLPQESLQQEPLS